ncbi:MAG: siderophore-interacting protein [Cystobacter sp.]
MASAKTFIGDVLGQFFFHTTTVTRVREPAARFRWVELEGSSLRDESFSPGDKVQVYLPGLGMRTYTPLSWDAQKGTLALLVYLHGAGPGAEWGRRVGVGDSVRFFGPRRSLKLDAASGPVVLFGDETSLGVAWSLRVDGRREVSAVFEVSQRAEVAPVLRELGLEGTEVERLPGDAHLSEVHERLRAALERSPGAPLVMTGRAQSIQTLKTRFKAGGSQPSGKTKAYWSVGKTGLD